MHIIIGFITAFAGLVWALNSLQNAGFDLNSLNPFALMRRRRWAKKLGTKPMHAEQRYKVCEKQFFEKNKQPPL